MMALAKFVLVSQYNYISLDAGEDIGAKRIVIYTFVYTDTLITLK